MCSLSIFQSQLLTLYIPGSVRFGKQNTLSQRRQHASVPQINKSLHDIAINLDLVKAATSFCGSLTDPMLSPSKLNHHPCTNSISGNSFFENKYGFTEESLLESNYRQRWPMSGPHLLKALNSFNFEQRRTFKRKSQVESSGIGEDRSVFSGIKTAFNKMSNPNKADKLKTLVKDLESSPDVRDKVKIAFAEGYMASNKGDAQAASGAWVKRLGKIFWYALICWLLLQLVQVYFPLGGNVKIRVLQGDRFEINPEEISVTFDDVKGMEEAKQELKDIVEFLRDPEKFKSLGAKLPKGVLLVGGPGIGKSLLARAVAGESGVPFFHASGSEFDEIFVGTGAKRVRQLFDAAKARSPCIVFIDEIDSVGAKRTSSQIHPYANQTINQLLSEMDGFQQNEGIIVLGATNRRDNLDKALLRPGRFDVEVRVYPPDLKGRKDILEHYLSKVKKGADINIDKLARSTTGCTGADLENLVNQAALKAVMDGDVSVTMIHMEFARDKILMGPAKKTKIPDEATNLMIACHEAGHALVAHYTKDATPLNKVTIIPRGTSLGHTSFIPDKEHYNHTRSQLLAQLDVSMGGRVAEELVYGADNVTTGAQADFSQATSIASAMVKQFGMSEKVGVRVFHEEDADTGMGLVKFNEVGPATTELVDNEIKRLLQESYERAKVVLKTHQAEHKSLITALMSNETLDAEEVKAILDGKTVSPKSKYSNPKTSKSPNAHVSVKLTA